MAGRRGRGAGLPSREEADPTFESDGSGVLRMGFGIPNRPGTRPDSQSPSGQSLCLCLCYAASWYHPEPLWFEHLDRLRQSGFRFFHPKKLLFCRSSLERAAPSSDSSSSINKEPTVCPEDCWTLGTAAIVGPLSWLPPYTCHSHCI